MKTIYHYVLNGMAEWETGYILQILKTANVSVKFAGVTKSPIKTLAGMTIVPDTTIDEINPENTEALILPGSDLWNNPENEAILKKALNLLENGVLVCAICGATIAIADKGMLNGRKHTSNALFYLKQFAKNYSGENLFVETNSCRDNNLITANVAGGLEFARDFAEALELFSPDYIRAWYNYYNTGDANYFMEMMKIGK